MPRCTKAFYAGFLLFMLIVPASVCARDAFVERPLSVVVPGAVMAGTAVDTPTGAVILFISGSGPTDRDGNSPLAKTDAIKLLARGLGERGFSSLRFDKRFSGETRVDEKDETQVTLDRYAKDAGQWLRLARERYPGRPVLPLGHSEGGIVALRLSQLAPVDGLVLLAVPARPLDEVVLEQMKSGNSPPAMIAAFEDAVARLRTAQPVGTVPEALRVLLRPGVYPFWRSMLAFDQPAALAALSGKAMLVYGGRDIQVSLLDRDLFLAARPTSVSRVFPEMNHVLRVAPADRAGNIALYRTPDAPLQPGLVDAVAGFLAQQAGPK